MTERILVPEDGQGNMTTDDAEDYYLPTYDVTQYHSWDESDPAAQMYQTALEACWEGEKP